MTTDAPASTPVDEDALLAAEEEEEKALAARIAARKAARVAARAEAAKTPVATSADSLVGKPFALGTLTTKAVVAPAEPAPVVTPEPAPVAVVEPTPAKAEHAPALTMTVTGMEEVAKATADVAAKVAAKVAEPTSAAATERHWYPTGEQRYAGRTYDNRNPGTGVPRYLKRYVYLQAPLTGAEDADAKAGGDKLQALIAKHGLAFDTYADAPPKESAA